MDNRTIEQVRKNETKLINEIKNLEQQCKKQKEVIDKVNKLINHYLKNTRWKLIPEILKELLDILKEV